MTQLILMLCSTAADSQRSELALDCVTDLLCPTKSVPTPLVTRGRKPPQSTGAKGTAGLTLLHSPGVGRASGTTSLPQGPSGGIRTQGGSAPPACWFGSQHLPWGQKAAGAAQL